LFRALSKRAHSKRGVLCKKWVIANMNVNMIAHVKKYVVANVRACVEANMKNMVKCNVEAHGRANVKAKVSQCGR
jgi:hypothetical protein